LVIEPTVVTFSSSPQLSGWDLTGLRRYQNCEPLSGISRPTWARVSYVLSDAAGTRTVQLKIGDTTLASGDAVGDGALTCSAVASGVSGTVNVTYTGDESGTVWLVWPSAYAIHYTTGSGFTGADFPRTAEATIYDDGQSNTHRWQSDVLTPATYYVVVHQVDEAGNESTGLASGGYTGTTYGPPAQINGLAYLTGDDSNTQITFTGGSGATGYDIYDSHAATVLDQSAPVFTTGDSGAITLSGITSGFSGYRYVLVRATLGGVDDGSSDMLRIEYSGGLVVLPRPPVPAIGTNAKATGLTIIVPTTVSLAEYDAVPAYVELYAWEIDTGSFDSGTPLSTGTIATGTMRVGAEIVITVSGTVAAAGEYFFLARTRSSDGITSDNSAYAGPVRLTTSQPPMPDSVEAKTS